MPHKSETSNVPEHLQKTVTEMQLRIQQQEEEIIKNKKLVNSLLEAFGQPRAFQDLDEPTAVLNGAIRGDEYYGQPLQTVVRDVLLRRRAANLGPASVADIHSAMLAGGYHFEARDVENAKRGLRISLTKNSATFTKLPGGKYGLREWYPAIKERRARTTGEEAVLENAENLEQQEALDGFDFRAKESTLAQ